MTSEHRPESDCPEKELRGGEYTVGTPLLLPPQASLDAKEAKQAWDRLSQALPTPQLPSLSLGLAACELWVPLGDCVLGGHLFPFYCFWPEL